MASFLYTARTQTGELQRGEVYAATRAEAVRRIQAHGLFTLSLRRKFTFGRIFQSTANRKYCMVFCRTLSLMLSAGLSINESLELLTINAAKDKQKMLADMSRRMAAGSTLATSMMRHSDVFSPAISSIIKAGEMGGSLEELLKRLADKEEKSWRVREKLHTALLYPAILSLAAIFAVSFIFLFVLPNFVSILSGFSNELPLPTRLVIGLGSFLEMYGSAFFAVLLLALFLLLLLYRQKRLRLLADRAFLRLPYWGKLRLDLEIMTLFDTLAVLMRSGSALHEALVIADGVLQNRFLAAVFSKITREVERGGTFSFAVAASGILPPLILELISIGEHTGELAAMLEKAAELCRFSGEIRAERLESMLEPLLVLFLGAIIGVIVLSVALPLLEMIGSYGY